MKFNKELFNMLYNLDITKMIELDYKKLKYLSWANAYKILLEYDVDSTYEVIKAADNMPYFTRGQVHFVYTRVSAFETTKEMYLPVMDNNHKAVAEPNSMQVNNAIQRCLVKNIAAFGIGLKLYTGEDLEGLIKDQANLITSEGAAKEFLQLIKQKEFDTDGFTTWLQNKHGIRTINLVVGASKEKIDEINKTLRLYKDKS